LGKNYAEISVPNPNSKKFVLIVFSGVACAFAGIVLGVFLHIPLLGFALVGLTFFLLFKALSRFVKPLEIVKSLISDAEAVKTSRWLAQQLIIWASERIKKPLKVVLVDANYSNVKIVGSLKDLGIIAEIEPKDVLAEKEQEAAK